jgi:hypothetical protein
MYRNLCVSSLAVLLVATFAGSAEAIPLTGEFSKTGIFEPFTCTAGVCVPGTLGGATAIDVTTTTGTPSPGVAGDVGSMLDFSFAGTGSAQFPLAPIASFEVYPNLTFNLATLSVQSQSAFVLVLMGTGTFVSPGFDPTPGNFVFTGQTAGSSSFSFSASQSATATGVPDAGSTVTLLGAALLALAAAQRRFFR